MSAPRSSDRHITLRLPRNTFKIAGIAFGIGILLFVLVWLSGRNNDFYKAAPVAVTAQQPSEQLDPLPEPLPAGDGASDMPDARPLPPAEETATRSEERRVGK
ncbi:MAG TPA: energy transducer TonB, partial [Xanthomonadaceae bacterium]|nr:energy transducer TonB [Xanthomonadaceae bacterium]